MLLKNPKRHIILIGHRGVGKTTLGSVLAAEYKLDFYDSDAELSIQTKKSTLAIFQHYGEQFFRTQESQKLKELSARISSTVIAVGAGAIVSAANRNILSVCGHCIFLDASVESLYQRTQTDTTRPWAPHCDRHAELQTLMKHRHPLYTSIADHTINTDHKSIQDILKQIHEYFFYNKTVAEKEKHPEH